MSNVNFPLQNSILHLCKVRVTSCNSENIIRVGNLSSKINTRYVIIPRIALLRGCESNLMKNVSIVVSLTEKYFFLI